MVSSFSGNWKAPTPEEVSVLGAVFSIVVVCVFGLGIFLLWLSCGQPPERSELAYRARWIAMALICGSVAVKFRWVLSALTWLDWARKQCCRH